MRKKSPIHYHLVLELRTNTLLPPFFNSFFSSNCSDFHYPNCFNKDSRAGKMSLSHLKKTIKQQNKNVLGLLKDFDIEEGILNLYK